MGWLSSLFYSDTGNIRAGKSQVFSSTHDAFSLPTSSPVFPSSHPDAFTPPTPEPATPTAFTYPPQGGYIQSSSRSGFTSLLPTHMDPLHIRTPYPPLSKTWARIQNWLHREYPELGDTLNYGILPQDLSEVEMQFGFALPAVVRESYLCVDGQEAESAAGCSEGLFFGLKLLPLESVLEEWRFWREVDHDPTTGANPALMETMQSIPPNWVRKAYSQRGWIPLIADKVGNYVGIDLSPGERGQVGQVIVFGRDFDTKVVLWRGDGPTGWAIWLASFAEELENGETFEIGNNEGSEGSEDELGYESYFYDGKGRGHGDGGGDTGTGGALRLTGEYKGWNVLEAWADRSLRKWHEAGMITDADLMPMAETPAKQVPKDVDIVDSQGSATETHIPILNNSQERISSPPKETSNHRSRQSQSTIIPTNPTKVRSVPIIAITKPPAPMPVGLPTAQDIAPIPSSPDSLHSDDDLEAGHGHGVELSSSTLTKEMDTEDIGLVTSTRRTGKSKSPIRRETSDTTDSALPLPPTPPADDVVTPKSTSFPILNPKKSPSTTAVPLAEHVPLSSTSNNVPDLLMESTATVMSSAPPLEPLQSSARTVQTEIPKPSSSKNDVEALSDDIKIQTTVRLIGVGGESGISRSPVEMVSVINANDQPEPSPPVATMAVAATPPVLEPPKKGHKKSKSGLANLKRFSVGALVRKKDSVSSMKDASR